MHVCVLNPYSDYYAVRLTTKEDVRILLHAKSLTSANLIARVLNENLWQSEEARPMGEIAPLFECQRGINHD